MRSWWWLVGSLGALWLWHDAAPADATGLVSPLDGDAPLHVTPHGYFGAPRAGPPAHRHQGVDLAAVPGSIVRAVGSGRIVQTRPGLGGTVRKLRLDRPAAWQPSRRPVEAVVYADLGVPMVQPGDYVEAGGAIARVQPRGFVHFAVKSGSPEHEIFFDPAEAGLVYRAPSTGPVT